MSAGIDRSRRGLLFGNVRAAAPSALRPPWARAEADFLDACSRCQDCVDACSEHILLRGDGGYPEVDFSRGECTFCQACVQACTQPAFLDPAATPPWNYVAGVGESCLAHQGVYCRSCGESCEAGAIGFSRNALRVPFPAIDHELCSGCGACAAVCPPRAIRIAAGETA